MSSLAGAGLDASSRSKIGAAGADRAVSGTIGGSLEGLTNGSLDEGAGDGAGVGSLNAWGALVSGLNSDTLP